MARNRFRTRIVTDDTDGAELKLVKKRKRWQVFYRPSEQNLRIGRIKARGELPEGDILLMEGVEDEDVVTTYPITTIPTSPRYLRPRYDTLRSITFVGGTFSEPEDADAAAELLIGAPPGFATNPYFGLGVKRELNYIIDAVEETDATDLRIVWRMPGPPKLEGSSFVLPRSLFENARKVVTGTHQRALRVASDEKRVQLNNQLLKRVDPKRFPERQPRYRKDAIVATVGRSPSIAAEMSPADQAVVLNMATATVRQASKREPAALMKLQQEIELVTLEALAKRFAEFVLAKKTETYWQEFLVKNPFVLHLAFGYPIAVVGDQVSVGGRKFSGSGDKITDFMTKTLVSGNIALIEIKGSEEPLIGARPYRGDLYAPTKELTAAVSQVLDQRYHLQRDISGFKDRSGEWDVQTYAVQCLVIAGRTPSEPARLKALELYRNSLKSVVVVTYDEMLGKLRGLLEFLGGETPPSVSIRRTARKRARSRARSAHG